VDVGRVISPSRPKGDRLVIPRIGLDARIIEASPPQALAEGVYHYPETADPGEPGNAVIAGHRIREVFTLLHVLKAGDPIIVYWRGSEHDYRVVRKFEVEPTNVSILERGTTEELTLYTCIPRSAGDRRTVVIAEPVTP
jgi:sortase A